MMMRANRFNAMGLVLLGFSVLIAAGVRAAMPCSADSDGDGVIDWQNNLACTGPSDDYQTVQTGDLVNGWTVFKKSADTQIYYVSASGSDSNAGTDMNLPLKTVAKGVSKLRNGYPDWLLLKRGDSFNEELILGTRSGRGATEPLVVSSYGPSTNTPVLNGSISVSGGSHVAVVHLTSVQSTTSGGSGASVYGTDVLLEGCRLEGGQYQAIDIGRDSGQSANLRARRNTVYKNHGHGIFSQYVDTLLIEGNVIIFPSAGVGMIHGMYLSRHPTTNLTVSDNLVYMNDFNDSNGIMQRPGGITRGNVIYGASMAGITQGACSDNGNAPPCYGADASVNIDNNLIMESSMGILYQMENSLPSPRVTNNLYLVSGNLSDGRGMSAGGEGAFVDNNIVAGANVYFYLISGDNQMWSNNSILNIPTAPIPNPYSLSWLLCEPNKAGDGCVNFTARGNRFYPWSEGNIGISFATWKADTGETGSNAAFSFPDPGRTPGTYNGSLGGAATVQAFFEDAANKSKYSYDARYGADALIAYIRAGFTTGPSDHTPPARPKGFRFQ